MKTATVTALSFVALGILGWQGYEVRRLGVEFTAFRASLHGLEERLSASRSEAPATGAEGEQSETASGAEGGPLPPSGTTGKERSREGDSTSPTQSGSPGLSEDRLAGAVEEALERRGRRLERDGLNNVRAMSRYRLDEGQVPLSEEELERVRELLAAHFDQLLANLPLPLEERQREWNRLHSLLCDDLRAALDEEELFQEVVASLPVAQHCRHER